MVIVMVKRTVMFTHFCTYKILPHLCIKGSLGTVQNSKVIIYVGLVSYYVLLLPNSFGLSQSDLNCEVAVLLRWSCGEVKLCDGVSWFDTYLLLNMFLG